jgi:hypothetical protein
MVLYHSTTEHDKAQNAPHNFAFLASADLWQVKKKKKKGGSQEREKRLRPEDMSKK